MSGLITDYKQIGGLPWTEHVEKYPQDLPRLQGMRVMSPEEYEKLIKENK